ncbi:MAG TPA: ATP-binding cassette domain-containing protein [Thermomicrobiales bacterium]|nr:ATP-binding cassette domain-containing protein [Thermomicrobiales bacterium]
MSDPRGGVVLEAKCITKTYGRTTANDCLTLSIRPGEIVGVLGENGAGKSTLLAILAGAIQPDSGQLLLNGKSTAFGSPRDALRAGVSIVFQHFALIHTFTVCEQMHLAGWRSRELPDLLGSRFSGNELIGDISLGSRQMVEIARALVSRPRVLLLDEPTSILTSAETQQLFVLLRGLKEQGMSVVFVTHKLHEAMEVCDRIVVLRKGKDVGELEWSRPGWPSGTDAGLLRLMFGRDEDGTDDAAPQLDTPELQVARSRDLPKRETGSLFCVQEVSTRDHPGSQALHRVSLDVGEGEICAIVGVDGQGQRELATVCAGYAPADGTVYLQWRALPIGDAGAFRRAGIAYLTDDRMGEGTVPGFTLEENLILKRQREWPFSRRGRLRPGRVRDRAREEVSRWRIEPQNPQAPIRTLSGGNIQKVLLARELSIASSLLIANNPSQGLDSRTRTQVWGAIKEFTDGQGGVLLFTTDINEALERADRVGVMYEGAVSPLTPVGDGIRSDLEHMMVAGW